MLGLLLALLPIQVAADTTGHDTVFYGGKLVRFHAKTEEVVLLDSAWVRYRDMTVYSDSIHYDTKVHRLSAFGDVLFTSGEQNVTGTMLQYDLDTRKGMMRTARTEVQNGFFWAEEVWLVKERVLNARRGYYTTCDHVPPHYCFYGPRMKLFMDDVAIAEPVVLEIFGVPVLAAPFWLVPVASKRKSGIMPFKVGNAKDQGLYAKDLAYYWVINDYADATLYMDVMAAKGIQPRLEAIYRVLPYADGSAQASYIQEWDTRRRRYSVNAAHVSRPFFFGADLSAKADYISDNSYAPEYAEQPVEWLKQDVFSFAELSRAFGRVTKVTARVEHENDFAHHYRRSTLPSARLSFGAQPLPLGWSASPNLTIGNAISAYSDSSGADTADITERNAGVTVGLSSPQYSLGKAGELGVSSNLGLSEQRSYRNRALSTHRPLSTGLGLQTSQKLAGAFNTYENLSFARSDNLADSTMPKPGYTGAVSTDFSIYRVFGIEAMGMHGLLHTARPSIGLSYEPEVDTAGFFGRLEPLSPSVAALDFALANSFEAKVGEGRTKMNLGRVNFGTAYDLRTKHLSPLRADAAVQPFQSLPGFNLQVNASADFDFDSMRLGNDYYVTTSLNWDKTLSRNPSPKAQNPESKTGDETPDSTNATVAVPQSEGWHVVLGLNHTYAKNQNMLRGSVGLTVPGWRLTLNSGGYNFVTKQVTDYSLTLWKDLHCWEAVVNLDRLGSVWRYDFEVQIKKLPSVKFGKSTFGPFLPQ